MRNECFSGFISEMQNIQDINTITCKEDLKQNWCTVVYSPQTQESEYNCFNMYAYNIFSGVPQCGDLPGEIQDSGCKVVKKMDGSDCIFCCCKGTLCNDPSVFLNIASNRHLYSPNNTNSKKNYVIILFIINIIIVYLFTIKIY
ncbi:Hypothetical protein SRAE_X000023300 [Strongyloides ratti]|uniref:Uncharacterized protein n=1 Tax=Strongyloides ratti TaxID=34506 RepID=A0A090N0L6_STRRB|nr:Hypothetical protein SRAE_X000023300 [Strongyloides ratti]CEF70903.1 Hypothetical protein SRAE_X000023300 [Strongyloides ratti]